LKQKFINLPYKCLLPLVSNKELLKAFCIYGKLKLMFTYSAIHNIKGRKKEIANKLEISENTFRKYLGILKSNFLVSIDQNDILRLAGRYEIYNVLKIKANFSENKNRICDKWYKLDGVQLNVDNIRFLAIKHKRENINYKNEERIKNIIVKTYGTIICPKIKSRIETNAKRRAKEILERNKENIAESFNQNSIYGFTDDNLSGKSISKIIGCKSPISGNRFMHRLVKDNKISYKKRDIYLKTLSHFTNISLLQEVNTLPVMIKKQYGVNALFLRVPNKWTLL